MVVDLLDRYQLDCDLVLNNGAQYRDRQNTINKNYPTRSQSFIKIANILHDYGYLLAIHTDKGKYSLHNQEDFGLIAWIYSTIQSDPFYLKKPLPQEKVIQETFTMPKRLKTL